MKVIESNKSKRKCIKKHCYFVATYIHVPPPPSAHSAHTHDTTLG